jgi:hypothetical protein
MSNFRVLVDIINKNLNREGGRVRRSALFFDVFDEYHEVRIKSKLLHANFRNRKL